MVSKPALGIALSACALAASTLPVHAAVSHITAVALHSSDAPSGLSAPHLRVYHHLPAKMQVTVNTAGAPGPSTCTLPTAFGSDGWRTGMIQAFDRSRATIALQVCASLFASVDSAHRAYGQLVAANLKPLLSVKQATKLSLGHVGDESSAIDRAMTECSCTSTKLQTYEVVFRHQNAVVDITYTGPSTYSAMQFAHLASGANSRLH